MIDSHCHLADKKFSSDLEDVLVRARDAGVDRIVTIADSLEEGDRCLELAEKYDHIFCTVGVHPHNAKEWKDGDEERLRSQLQSSKKIVALGEIGLDYHYMNSPKEDQIRVFKLQLDIAKEIGLPVVCHNRESITDFLSIVSEKRPDKLVLHCNTERWEDCAELIDMGYLFGFTGIATYPKSDEIRRTIEHCPLDRMMIETDAPYLAPDSQRGERNEPAFVRDVAELIAEIKGLSVKKVDAATTKNAEEFYGL